MQITHRLGGVLVAVACGTSAAWAHPIPDAEAMLQVSGGGDYSISVRLDVAAFVMQATPEHLGKAVVEQLQAMSDDELNSRIADAQAAFQKQLTIEFDGLPAKPTAIKFPTAEKVRSAAREHGAARRFVRIRGTAAKGARSMAIALPADLGRVLLTFEQDDAEPVRHTLAAGEKSPPLRIGPSGPHSALEESHSFKFGLLAVALAAFATVGWLKRR